MYPKYDNIILTSVILNVKYEIPHLVLFQDLDYFIGIIFKNKMYCWDFYTSLYLAKHFPEDAKFRAIPFSYQKHYSMELVDLFTNIYKNLGSHEFVTGLTYQGDFLTKNKILYKKPSNLYLCSNEMLAVLTNKGCIGFLFKDNIYITQNLIDNYFVFPIYNITTFLSCLINVKNKDFLIKELKSENFKKFYKFL